MPATTIELPLSPRECAALDELVAATAMTPQQVLRQALRHYQAAHLRARGLSPEPPSKVEPTLYATACSLDQPAPLSAAPTLSA